MKKYPYKQFLELIKTQEEDNDISPFSLWNLLDTLDEDQCLSEKGVNLKIKLWDYIKQD